MDRGAPSGVVGRRSWRAALLASVITISGCPFVLPTPGLQYDAPSKDVVRAIEPTVTTRADVLMMLGDPSARVADDRFFVYHWSETHAVYGLVLPGGGLVGGSLDDRHALVLEFGPDARVVRFGALANDQVGEKKAEEALWEKIRAWMKAAQVPVR